MAILRTIQCTCCRATYTELKHGDGFPGWMGMSGIALNGDPDPYLCPSCKEQMMDLIDAKVEEIQNGLD